MYETEDGYVFATFQDGNVIFYKDSYKTHCSYHDEIRGDGGRNNIQEALINPHFISSYPFMDTSGNIVARCKKYRWVTKERYKTHRGEEWEYWEIILKKNRKSRKKIATAFRTSSLKPLVVNDRIEKIVYQRAI